MERLVGRQGVRKRVCTGKVKLTGKLCASFALLPSLGQGRFSLDTPMRALTISSLNTALSNTLPNTSSLVMMTPERGAVVRRTGPIGVYAGPEGERGHP